MAHRLAGFLILMLLVLSTVPAAAAEPSRTLQRQGIVVRYDPLAAGWAADVHKLTHRSRELVESRLGLEFDGPIRIELPGSEERFEERTQAIGGSIPPRWAIAVAYPSLRTIVFRASRLGDQGPEGVAPTLLHELAHVLLWEIEREAGRLPRWLHEGLAMWAANETLTAQERAELQGRARRGQLLPLADITDTFPPHDATASLAYHQSFSLVQHLADEHGREVPRQLLAGMRQGRTFEQALQDVAGLTPEALEEEWSEKLEAEHSYWMEILVSVPFFGFMALLVVLAWWRKRSQMNERLAEMAREEALTGADRQWTDPLA